MRKIAYWLSLGLVFVIPFQNVVDVQGVGTIAQAVGLVVMAFWVLTVAGTGHVRRPVVFHAVALVFVLWHTLSAVWSIDAPRTLETSWTYIQLFALTYLIWDLYPTRRAVFQAFQVYVLGAYVSFASLLLNYQAGITEASRRYSATGFNSNKLAMILAFGLPLAWALVVSPPGKRAMSRLLRIANVLYLPAGTFGILLTASRAGFFGALPFLGLILVTLRRFRLRSAALAIVLAGAAGAFLWAAVPETSVERLANTGTEMRQGDWNDRLAIWRESWRSVGRQPLLGTGGGTHRLAALETQKGAHNAALALMVEVGLIGLLFYLAVLGLAAEQIRRLSRWDQWFWLTLLGIWFLNNLTHSFEDTKSTWLLLGLAVAAANCTPGREESRVRLVPQPKAEGATAAAPR